MEHESASVAFEDYRSLLMFLDRQLSRYQVYLLADRGFVHRHLMRWVKRRPAWHFRIRYKSGIGLYHWKAECRRYAPLHWQIKPGRVVCYHGVYVIRGYEAVHVAVGWEKGRVSPG